MHSLLLGMQVVLAVPAEALPARFGVPVEPALLERGLAADGGVGVAWRPLPLQDGAMQWIEVALAGGDGRGTVRVRAARGVGDAGPGAAGGSGTGVGVPVVRVDRDDAACTCTWTFGDGTVDTRVRTRFAAPAAVDAERFAAGEWRTIESEGLPVRARAALRLPRQVWQRARVLPPETGLGRPLRAHLVGIAHSLRELPGARGAGDYARSGDVVTNLEFDTTLALLRLALAAGDEDLLQRARRSALHLLDRDLDADTGLPFPHGADHRTGRPEPGHAWLTGLLLVGAVTADDLLLDGARRLARALAANPPAGQGRDERARDHGWPLHEMEQYLVWCDDEIVRAAADRLALQVAMRWSDELRTFRFGEGEQPGGAYLERAWLTFGIVVPALQAHLRRRPDRDLQRRVDAAVQRLLDVIVPTRLGLPTHWRCAGGDAFGVHVAAHDPRAFLLLEALAPADLRRIVRRPDVWRSLQETPRRDDPDLATSFTIVARCAWLYR